MQTKAQNTEWKRLYRASKRDTGICTECSKKAAQGHVTCKYHLEYTRQKVADRRRRKLKNRINTK